MDECKAQAHLWSLHQEGHAASTGDQLRVERCLLRFHFQFLAYPAQAPCKLGVIVAILQMEKLRLREIKKHPPPLQFTQHDIRRTVAPQSVPVGWTELM